MTKLEEIARAISWSAGLDPDGVLGTPGVPMENWRRFRGPARTVLTILREATPAMIAAGHRAMGGQGAHDCEVPPSDILSAMIDALLPEGSQEGK